MEILSVFGILAAAAIGFLFGRKYSSNQVEKDRLEQQLKEKTLELETYHSKVNTHFEKTSQLFNHVSDSYQSLYDHMAKSSSALCANPTFQSLPKAEEETAKIEENMVFKQAVKNPKPFNANNLYNAYNDQDASNEEKNKSDIPVDDNKVVEISSAKEDINAQALDYAIKEKGTINHNSLDIEEAKNP